MERIYLDHNATTPVHPRVLEAILPFLTTAYGNPSSVHFFGQEVRGAVEQSRRKVADLIGCESIELSFTSGGTEADNMALCGVARANSTRGKHIITTSIEHPAVIQTCKYLETQGFRVTYVAPDQAGIVSPKAIETAICSDTILISVMLANNEVGSIQNVRTITRMAKKRGVLVHTDAVQAAGKFEINVDDLGVDLLCLSGHKIQGPKGIGALYVRKHTAFTPLFHGGNQERGIRSGTENIPGIIGFAEAVELAKERLSNGDVAALEKKRDALQSALVADVAGARVHAIEAKRLPNTLNIAFEGVVGNDLLVGLDLRGIAVSAGSACSSGAVAPSHVLTAMAIPAERAREAIRISIGHDFSDDQISNVVAAIARIVEQNRKFDS